MEGINKEKARFDTRLPREQKLYFERAALLGGYRNLTDFVIATLQSRAKEIIEESERVIASQKDREIFFDALNNPPVPNAELMAAKEAFDKMLGE